MDAIDRFRAGLTRQRRDALVRSAFYFSQSARDAAFDERLSADAGMVSVSRGTASIEIIQTLLRELLADMDPRPEPVPDEDLIAELLRWARLGHCESELAWALSRAADDLEPSPSNAGRLAESMTQ